MKPHRLEITLQPEVLEGLDAARGHEPRASFVKRALETALSEGSLPPDKKADASAARSSAAPSQASATTEREVQGLRNVVSATKSRDELAMERQRKMNERKS